MRLKHQKDGLNNSSTFFLTLKADTIFSGSFDLNMDDWNWHNFISKYKSWKTQNRWQHCRLTRPRRWIVTIPSLDQWLPTIGNHWKTIASNGCRTTKPLKTHWHYTKNHWKTIGTNGLPDQKPLVSMVFRPKTTVKPLIPMVVSKLFIYWQIPHYLGYSLLKRV